MTETQIRANLNAEMFLALNHTDEKLANQALLAAAFYALLLESL